MNVEEGVGEQPHVTQGEDAGAVRLKLDEGFLIDDQRVAADAVHEDVAVRLALQEQIDLDVAVGVDRVAAALQGQAAIPSVFQDDRRMVLIIAAAEECVDIDAGTVVFRVIERVVDLTVALESEMVFRRFAVSADQENSRARGDLPVVEHDGVVHSEVRERDVDPVGVERDRAAAHARIGQIQRFAGFHRVVADVEDGLVHFRVRDVDRRGLAFHDTSVFSCDDA